MQIVEPQRQAGGDPEQVAFKRFLTNFQETNLYEQGWNMLKTSFIQTSHVSKDPLWVDFPHLFFTIEVVFSMTCQSFRPWYIQFQC